MKVFKLFLLNFLVCGLVFAGTVTTTILDTTLDDSPTFATSSTVRLHEFRKTGFFVDYDETEVGNSISAIVRLDVGHDSTEVSDDFWEQMSFFDVGGGVTPQTSENLSSDGLYFFWLPIDTIAPFARVTVTATSTDADDILDIEVRAIGIK